MIEVFGYSLGELLFRLKFADAQKHRREDGEVFVTDLVLCGVRLQKQRKFPEIEPSNAFNSRTLEGDIVHKGVQTVLKEVLGDRVQVEVEGSKEVAGFRLKGRIDAIVDGKYGVEIKHVKSDYGIGTYKHHMLQALIYWWMFDLESVELLYISGDRSTSIPVEGSLTEEDIAKLILEPKPVAEEWVCRYCEYSFSCQYKLTGKVPRGELQP
ncbi:MAG: hypothetical protein QXT14_03005 [Candidatus Bathyarchaeia archaeon]